MKKNQVESAEFPTRDIYLASILKQSGIPLIRVENHSGRGVFVFQTDERIQGIIQKYFNDALEVNPKSLFEDWKALKSMVYSSVGNVR